MAVTSTIFILAGSKICGEKGLNMMFIRWKLEQRLHPNIKINHRLDHKIITSLPLISA